MTLSDTSIKQERVDSRMKPVAPTLKTEYIFIVGVSRSGTSLMRHILNQSDSIAISRENHFLGHLLGSEGTRRKFQQFGDLSDDENVRKLVNFIYSGGLEKSSKLRGLSSHWRWVLRRVKKEDFEAAILASDRTERGLFTVLMQLFADRKGKPIMGEKTPSHVRYVPTLLEWFPKAKVIHMIRDPRGIYVSELRRRYAESESAPYKQLKRVYPLFKTYILLQTIATWLDSVNRCQQYRKDFPGEYYPLRFEDLVREPETNIRSLCEFLGVDFQPEMLDQSVVSSGFQVGQAGFDAQAADRWKKVITPWSSFWLTFCLRRPMKAFGYIP